jgi:hypothetical protein
LVVAVFFAAPALARGFPGAFAFFTVSVASAIPVLLVLNSDPTNKVSNSTIREFA